MLLWNKVKMSKNELYTNLLFSSNDKLEFHFSTKQPSFCSLKDGKLEGKWKKIPKLSDLDHSKLYSWRTLEFEPVKIVMAGT